MGLRKGLMAELDHASEDATVFMKPGGLVAPAAVDDIGHYLVVLDGQVPPRRIALDHLPLTVGRASPPADLVLAGGDVSRRHCTFDLDGDRLVVTDLGSTNGTFVEGERLAAPAILQDGVLLRIGAHDLRYERRSRRDIALSEELDKDLEQAQQYVLAVLPPPLTTGPVQVDWVYVPCARLAGDAFGYQRVDARTFTGFVFDVSGHGVSAAVHAVAVANVLRQQALPGVDFRDPSQVLCSLNSMFQMDTHNELFFTVFYWVFDLETRVLTYCSAGHHPAFLMPPGGGEPAPLWTRNPAAGMMPDRAYSAASTTVPPGSHLYLFSDGAFEIETAEGKQWGLDDFLPLLRDSTGTAAGEPQRLYAAVRKVARPGPLDDDFSAVVIAFP